MKKISLSSILSQLLLLFFVIVWIIPTFGLFISSLRDKDLLAISGWWTALTTTEINEFKIGDIAIFKDESEVILDENGNYEWRSKSEFQKKKGKRLFTTSLSPPSFTFENYREVLFKDCLLYTSPSPRD